MENVCSLCLCGLSCESCFTPRGFLPADHITGLDREVLEVQSVMGAVRSKTRLKQLS